VIINPKENILGNIYVNLGTTGIFCEPAN